MKSFHAFIRKNPRIVVPSVLISILYACFYYVSLSYTRFVSGQALWLSLPNWYDKLFKLRAPFLFEPLFRWRTGIGIEIDIAPLNVAIAIILAVLVFYNVFLLILSIKMPKVCKISSKSGRMVAMLPAFLTGFACCAPTFVIMWVGVLGTFSSVLISLARWTLPLGFVLLTLGIVKSLQKLDLKA